MPYTPLRRPNPESLPTTITNLLGFHPCDGQIEAIRSLTVNQEDLILIAPTGWERVRYSKQFQPCKAVFALKSGQSLTRYEKDYRK